MLYVLREACGLINWPERGDPVFFRSSYVSHVELATGNDPNAKVQYGNWTNDGRAKSWGSIERLITNDLNENKDS